MPPKESHTREMARAVLGLMIAVSVAQFNARTSDLGPSPDTPKQQGKKNGELEWGLKYATTRSAIEFRRSGT